ncbi:DUF29 domain-containing protein [Dolichospermum sp. ST_sed3]|nr:DUF29 domain-containing protein [Dolichospermum sp. ST_sed9]MDD1441918.1 DUF29 domain-containing protein [Dolichospermum sp. ST_sed3]MDD1457130.1 DUF29 domain-containing protein [Dolichospermum sp. ST_sed7]MDD1466299.1 DUF29 domain-containing protein [Dolichospermum sp. ST_sed5]MDD1472103.1 DUF29 domain-containing protein [Dolichospermum sp. ST_sed4]
MTQELIDLRNSILEQRYTDALAIVDELEGMSKQAILRNIQAFLKILLIHLVKNQIEKRLTNSWVASIRNSLIEIKKINLKENKKSYYINQDEWDSCLEDEIELAIADASLEVMNGIYNEFQLAEMVNRNEVTSIAREFLQLTHLYSVKELPKTIVELLIQLPGGEDWKLGKK